jgi:hypothetical protein
MVRRFFVSVKRRQAVDKLLQTWSSEGTRARQLHAHAVWSRGKSQDELRVKTFWGPRRSGGQDVLGVSHSLLRTGTVPCTF